MFLLFFNADKKKRIKSSEAKQNAKMRKNKGRQNKSLKGHKHTERSKPLPRKMNNFEVNTAILEAFGILLLKELNNLGL